MLYITAEREAKIKAVVARRQTDLTVILENVHDPHNIGAVLRSCDTVGVNEIFVIYTQKGRNTEAQYVGFHSASGAKKWVTVHFFEEIKDCIEEVRSRYAMIYGTHLSADSDSLYDLDLTKSTALVFGNEHSGISDELLQHLDGNFVIPQYGMVQSLNISVACAVTLFEASRQRNVSGRYNKIFDENSVDHQKLYQNFLESHNPRYFGLEK